MLNNFFEFANANGDDDWTISLWTCGGMLGIAHAILHIINARKERVTLICIEAYSSGFEILYKAECKKFLTQECKGMVHLTSADIRLSTSGKSFDPEHACIIKNWNERKKDMHKEIIKILTKEEFKSFNAGDEIYFTTKRMKEIFPDAGII